jgi:hypothetical protein
MLLLFCLILALQETPSVSPNSWLTDFQLFYMPANEADRFLTCLQKLRFGRYTLPFLNIRFFCINRQAGLLYFNSSFLSAAPEV